MEAARTDFTRATELTPEVGAAIEDAFDYHPWTQEQVEAGKRVRLASDRAIRNLSARLMEAQIEIAALKLTLQERKKKCR